MRIILFLNICSFFRNEHDIHNEPSPTYDGSIRGANPELAGVLSNLRKTEHQLQGNDHARCSPMSLTRLQLQVYMYWDNYNWNRRIDKNTKLSSFLGHSDHKQLLRVFSLIRSFIFFLYSDRQDFKRRLRLSEPPGPQWLSQRVGGAQIRVYRL